LTTSSKQVAMASPARQRQGPYPGNSPFCLALGLSVAELAMRAALTDDDIERIEEGGTEPTVPILRRLTCPRRRRSPHRRARPRLRLVRNHAA
jgi:hypothetical protein